MPSWTPAIFEFGRPGNLSAVSAAWRSSATGNNPAPARAARDNLAKSRRVCGRPNAGGNSLLAFPAQPERRFSLWFMASELSTFCKGGKQIFLLIRSDSVQPQMNLGDF